MANLLSCSQIAKAYTHSFLFQGVSFQVGERDRVGVIGPNGAGKSTFLKILCGVEESDEGEVITPRGVRSAYVAQETSFDGFTTTQEAAEQAYRSSHEGLDDGVAPIVARLLGKAGFTEEHSQIAKLSGGWRKRLSLVCGLVQEPDILYLDEPTNHLDLEGILWLEEVLLNARFAWVMVSHDRYLLENCASRMVEVNKIFQGGVLDTDGSYSKHLENRQIYLSMQASQAQSLASKVRREKEWLSRNPKARGTKAKYRVDAAQDMMQQLGEVRARMQTEKLNVDFASTGSRTKRLIELKNLGFTFPGKQLFTDLSLSITPGMALGLLGGNGSGKSTLLKVLNDDLPPSAGQIKKINTLQVVYFDQQRKDLDDRQTLKDALVESGDSVVYRGESMHVRGWAQRFRFKHEQLNQEVGSLSGGERARLLISRFMLRPADVLLLDEPTNDLDIDTIEVLEESLLSFPGALVLVSHDRFLLNRVCTHFLGFDGVGGISTYADFGQWQENLKRVAGEEVQERPVERGGKKQERKPLQKLSYNEQRELGGIESAILKAEKRLEKLTKALEDTQGQGTEAYTELDLANQEVEKLYARWDELEEKKKRLVEGK